MASDNDSTGRALIPVQRSYDATLDIARELNASARPSVARALRALIAQDKDVLPVVAALSATVGILGTAVGIAALQRHRSRSRDKSLTQAQVNKTTPSDPPQAVIVAISAQIIVVKRDSR